MTCSCLLMCFPNNLEGGVADGVYVNRDGAVIAWVVDNSLHDWSHTCPITGNWYDVSTPHIPITEEPPVFEFDSSKWTGRLR